jgi:hypothetical protein
MASKLEQLSFERQSELAKTNTPLDPHTGKQIKSVADMSDAEFETALRNKAWRGVQADVTAARKEWKDVK